LLGRVFSWPRPSGTSVARDTFPRPLPSLHVSSHHARTPWELSEDVGEYALPDNLRMMNGPTEVQSRLSIAVSVVEWDGSDRDGHMTSGRASEPIRTGVAGTGAIVTRRRRLVGERPARCWETASARGPSEVRCEGA
jgi:hypothetical protein